MPGGRWILSCYNDIFCHVVGCTGTEDDKTHCMYVGTSPSRLFFVIHWSYRDISGCGLVIRGQSAYLSCIWLYNLRIFVKERLIW